MCIIMGHYHLALLPTWRSMTGKVKGGAYCWHLKPSERGWEFSKFRAAGSEVTGRTMFISKGVHARIGYLKQDGAELGSCQVEWAHTERGE